MLEKNDIYPSYSDKIPLFSVSSFRGGSIPFSVARACHAAMVCASALFLQI